MYNAHAPPRRMRPLGVCTPKAYAPPGEQRIVLTPVVIIIIIIITTIVIVAIVIIIVAIGFEFLFCKMLTRVKSLISLLAVWHSKPPCYYMRLQLNREGYPDQPTIKSQTNGQSTENHRQGRHAGKYVNGFLLK